MNDLYSSLKISDTKTEKVGFSKTSHFLLSNLVMPTNGKYTMKFVYNGSNVNYNQNIMITLRYKTSSLCFS